MNEHFSDTLDIKGTRLRDDGYLVVDARVARTGIQRYLGSEVGMPEKEFVDVYRSPEEVFSDDALASFAHRPVTNDHPSEPVTADNWKRFAVGQTSDEIRRDGDFVRIPLMVADAAVIKAVQDGKRELSNGYLCDLKHESGVTPEGETYDAIQTNIRGNHVAIVRRGRAGSECRIGDGSVNEWGSSPITNTQQKDHDNMSNNDLRIAMVDGLPIQTTDAGAQAIAKLIGDIDTLKQQNQTLVDSARTAQETHDAELAKKDAEIAAADAKVLDQTAVDALVADRVALETQAVAICADLKTAGLSDSEVRAAVVKQVMGDEALNAPADKSDAYKSALIDAKFDLVVAEHAKGAKTTDAFRETVKGITPNLSTDAAAARQAAFNGLVHFDATGQEVKVN